MAGVCVSEHESRHRSQIAKPFLHMKRAVFSPAPESAARQRLFVTEFRSCLRLLFESSLIRCIVRFDQRQQQQQQHENSGKLSSEEDKIRRVEGAVEMPGVGVQMGCGEGFTEGAADPGFAAGSVAVTVRAVRYCLDSAHPDASYLKW